MKTAIFCIWFLFCLGNASFIARPFDTWDYVFNGTCDKNNTICVPYSKISFSHIWENYTDEQIISEANEFIKTYKPLKKKIHIDRSREWFQQNFGIFVDEKVNELETLASFELKDLYSSSLDLIHFKEMPYYDKHMEVIQRLNLTNESSFIRLGFNLLYHFYHFEDSPLKADLRLFPRKPLAPLLRFSNYEINLLQRDEAQKSILNMRKNYVNSFIVIRNKIIQANLEDEVFRDFFNRGEVRIDDWVYVYSLINSYSVYDFSNEIETSFIPPIIRLVVEAKERETKNKNDRILRNWDIKRSENNTLFHFNSLTQLLKKDEVLVESQNTQYDIWLNMGFLTKREDSCIHSNLVPKEIEENFKLPCNFSLI